MSPHWSHARRRDHLCALRDWVSGKMNLQTDKKGKMEKMGVEDDLGRAPTAHADVDEEQRPPHVFGLATS